MAEPTNYDIVQDGRLDGLESLITSNYQPPTDQEFSFPVAGQGITSQMFRQISRAAGTGIYIQSNDIGAHEPYYLTNLPGGAAATNANNQMLLKVAPVTGRAEAAIEGFFHTLLQDMVVDFPAVSSPTTYYLCLTYDPRREKEQSGPIRVEVHANTLPTSSDRKHIVLWTVQRQPNQLLTDATITQTNQWLGHVINVWREEFLPEPTQTEYGTLAVVVNPGSGMTSDPQLFTNRGVHGWQAVTTPRETISGTPYLVGNWKNYGSGYAHFRITKDKNYVTLEGQISGDSWSSNVSIVHLPEGFRPKDSARMIPVMTPGGAVPLVFSPSGTVRPLNHGAGLPAWISFESTFFPLF